MSLQDLYTEIYELTNKICATCDPPHSCCELAGCMQAASWASYVYKVWLKEVSPQDEIGRSQPMKASCASAPGASASGNEAAVSPKDRDTADHTAASKGSLREVMPVEADIEQAIESTRGSHPPKTRLPYLSNKGCTVAIEHRRLCTTWLCPQGKQKAPPRYQELLALIVKAEVEEIWKP